MLAPRPRPTAPPLPPKFTHTISSKITKLLLFDHEYPFSYTNSYRIRVPQTTKISYKSFEEYARDKLSNEIFEYVGVPIRLGYQILKNKLAETLSYSKEGADLRN
jgi:hypothetical protein